MGENGGIMDEWLELLSAIFKLLGSLAWIAIIVLVLILIFKSRRKKS